MMLRVLSRSFIRSFKSYKSGHDHWCRFKVRAEFISIYYFDFTSWLIVFRVSFGLVTSKFMVIKLWSVIVSETCIISIYQNVKLRGTSNVCRPVCVGSLTSCFRPKMSIRSAHSMHSWLSGLSQWLLKSPRMRRWPGRVETTSNSELNCCMKSPWCIPSPVMACNITSYVFNWFSIYF